MLAEEIKAIARREAEEIESKGNLALVDEMFAPDFRLHFPGYLPMDRAGFKQLITAFRSAFPDLRVTIEDQVAEAEKVANRLTIRGTHEGSFQGVPATGETIEVSALNVVRVENGKLAEIWGMPDVMGLMRQLGAVPAPESTEA